MCEWKTVKQIPSSEIQIKYPVNLYLNNIYPWDVKQLDLFKGELYYLMFVVPNYLVTINQFLPEIT